MIVDFLAHFNADTHESFQNGSRDFDVD